MTRIFYLWLACATASLMPQIAAADWPSELRPSLLAVTITDFEVDASSSGHSAYWAYDADVEATLGGPKFEGKIRFIIGKATDLGRVFPAQYVLVFERDRLEMEEHMGTSIEAIWMQDAKKTACFPFDLADVFPDNARFAHGVANSTSSSGYCYESSDLLADLSHTSRARRLRGDQSLD